MPNNSAPVPTLTDLAPMTAAELRAAIVAIDNAVAPLHLSESGEVRTDLTRAESDQLDGLLSLRGRAEAHLHVRESFDRTGGERTFGGTLVRSGADPLDGDPTRALRLGGDELRSAALRMVEARGADLPAAAVDQLEGSIRAQLGEHNVNLDGEVIARRTLLTENADYRSAFQELMTAANPLLNDGEVRAVRAFRSFESRAMGEVTPSAGGVGVPVTLDPSILLTAGAAVAPLLSAARVTPVTSNVWRGVTTAPPSFVFQTEAAAATDNSPTLAQPTVNVHMARGFIPYSIEVGMDYPGFASEMSALLQAGWTDLLASKTITGSGTGEPKGILTALDAVTASEVRLTTAGTFDGQQLFRAWNALPERFRARASWLASVSTESAIRSFGATPAPSSYFTIDLGGGQSGLTRLNGRPALITDSMPSWTSGVTTTQNVLIVGDLANYLIAMRAGLTVEQVPHLFQQVTAGTGPAFPTGQRGWLAWGRWGADVVAPQGLRLLNQT